MTDLLTLIEQDLGPGRRMGTWTFWRCPFHAGDNEPSLGVRNGRYFCFSCKVVGDAVDWLVKYRRMSMKEALRQVKGNGSGRGRPVVRPDDIPPLVKPDLAWREEAAREVSEAAKRLDSNLPDGLEVMGYLTSRGLSRHTIDTWLLGAAWVRWPGVRHEVLAVSIPYLGRNGEVTAIKYRVIGDLRPRYIMRKGSKPGLFGTWQELKPLLILVEGEINALSVWQVLGGQATVLSCGGQTSHLDLAKRLLAEVKKQSKNTRTFVWFDEPKIAQAFAPLAGKVVASPILNGTKFDANSMLVSGVGALSNFLEKLGVEK